MKLFLETNFRQVERVLEVTCMNMNISGAGAVEKIARHDTSLFEAIQSQSTRDDQKSLLVLHSVIRRILGQFTYLEIGSHLGGSLQAMVADPACTRIISIDPRPLAFSDQRGIVSKYPENSSQRMLDLLSVLPGADISKIQTIESDSSKIDLSTLSEKPHFCFIDGEHTNEAALRDAQFCRKAMGGRGLIAFHDANVVYSAIEKFIQELGSAGLPFRAYLLADAVFVIELGEAQITGDLEFIENLKESYKGFLSGLKMNEWYRAALNQPFFLFLRRIRFVRRLFVVKNFAGGQPI